MDELEQILCAGVARPCTTEYTKQNQQDIRFVQNTNILDPRMEGPSSLALSQHTLACHNGNANGS
jgi:hypothetical protein